MFCLVVCINCWADMALQLCLLTLLLYISYATYFVGGVTSHLLCSVIRGFSVVETESLLKLLYNFSEDKMVRMNSLADALRTLNNAEKGGKRQVILRPSSRVVIKFLTVMMKHGYIGEFEIIDDHRAGKIVVNLIGRLNKCGVISPRLISNLFFFPGHSCINHTMFYSLWCLMFMAFFRLNI